MVTKTYYPSAYYDNDGWGSAEASPTCSGNDPSNLLNVPDGHCACRSTLSTVRKCFLKLYKDSDGNAPAIPAGSTINHVYTNGHAVDVTLRISGYLVYWLHHSNFYCGQAAWATTSTISCDNCGDNYDNLDCIDAGWTAEDINALGTEDPPTTTETWVEISSDGLSAHRGMVDGVWITVDYTPPSAAQPVGDGLGFAQ